jgi:hypothetical protein
MGKKRISKLAKQQKRLSKESPGINIFAYTANKDIQNIRISIDWDNITYENGFILIKVNGIAYKSYYKDSQKSFNIFKPYFSHSNTPNILVQLNGKEITLLNEEIILYHFKLFKQSSKNFGSVDNASNPFNNWKEYTKDYYQKKLSHLFVTDSLKKLFLLSNPIESIIPVAEVTKDIKGKIQFIDSFLFHISNYIVWESTEPSRATYIFYLGTSNQEIIQYIFDYISGDTISKRDTLIKSKNLQKQLRFKTRVFHTDFSLWLNHLKNALNL